MGEQLKAATDVAEAVETFRRVGRTVAEAFDALSRSLVAAADAVAAAVRRLWPPARVQLRAVARARRGGSGDVFGLWQCGPCVGWLHESCRDDGLLDCGCTCRGGDLR